MSSNTTIRSPGAIALGTLFALGTCYVLFADVKSLAGITVDHVMTLLVLTGTIASGHMVWHQARAWRVLPALGLAVLFMAGTLYCVVTSAGRNSETSGLKQAEIAKRNGELADLRSRIDEARDDVRRQKASEEAECKSGEGTKCKGRTKLRTAAESHLGVLEARLELSRPAQQENASQKHAAKLFAALPFVSASAEQIEGLLDLFVPFFKALFLELATILFLGLGIGHGKRASVAAGGSVATGQATFSASFSRPAIVGKRSFGKRSCGKDAVISALAAAGRPLSNGELAAAMRVSHGEASKRRKEIEHLLSTERRGKQVAVSLRQLH